LRWPEAIRPGRRDEHSSRRDQASLANPRGAGNVRVAAPGVFARIFGSLAEREFRWFYIGMLGQMASMNMQMVVRGYLAYVLTGSYAILGLVGLMSAIPMLMLSMFGGVIADRVPKRTVLQAGQAANLGIAAFIAVLIFTGFMAVPWLLLSAAVQGVVSALMMPSRQAMVAEIVPNDRLMNAVSLNMAGMNTMRLLAPAIGGFIVASAGFEWAYLVMASLYGLAILGLARVTWRPAADPGEAGIGAGQIWRRSIGDIKQGLVYIRNDRLMLALLSVSFVASFFAMPYLFLLPGYVADIFDGDGTQVGLMISVSAVGALAGALMLASLPSRHRGLLLLAGLAILGVGLIGFTQTSSFAVAGAFMVVVGLGSALRQALTQGLLHHYVDDAYRGRVMAVFMTQVSVMQFGTFIVGIAAELAGIRVAFAATGVGLLIVTMLVFLFVPRIRHVQ